MRHPSKRPKEEITAMNRSRRRFSLQWPTSTVVRWSCARFVVRKLTTINRVIPSSIYAQPRPLDLRPRNGLIPFYVLYTLVVKIRWYLLYDALLSSRNEVIYHDIPMMARPRIVSVNFYRVTHISCNRQVFDRTVS